MVHLLIDFWEVVKANLNDLWSYLCDSSHQITYLRSYFLLELIKFITLENIFILKMEQIMRNLQIQCLAVHQNSLFIDIEICKFLMMPGNSFFDVCTDQVKLI